MGPGRPPEAEPGDGSPSGGTASLEGGAVMSLYARAPAGYSPAVGGRGGRGASLRRGGRRTGRPPPFQKLNVKEEFEIVRLVGTGNFSEVFHVVLKTGARAAAKGAVKPAAKAAGKAAGGLLPGVDFAMKVFDKVATGVGTCKLPTKEARVKSLNKEAEVLMEKHCLLKLQDRSLEEELGYRNVLRLFWTSQDQASVFLISEYHPGGELWDLVADVGVLEADLARFYAAHLVNALEFMHRQGIVHRDLKAENILVTRSGDLCVIDFGSAVDLTRPDVKVAGNSAAPRSRPRVFEHYVGTPQFMPPEAVRNRGAGRAFDLWSLGATLFQILGGRPPFDAPSAFLVHLRSRALDLDFPPDLDPRAVDLIRRLLVVDPQKRLAARERDLAALRQHPFFEGVDFQRLEMLVPADECRRGPSLMHLCFSHMARQWDRFAEKWAAGGWLASAEAPFELTPGPGPPPADLESYKAPARPAQLEERSRQLVQLGANALADAQVLRAATRVLFWKNCASRRTAEYWDGLTKRFLDENPAASGEARSAGNLDESGVDEEATLVPGGAQAFDSALKK